MKKLNYILISVFFLTNLMSNAQNKNDIDDAFRRSLCLSGFASDGEGTEKDLSFLVLTKLGLIPEDYANKGKLVENYKNKDKVISNFLNENNNDLICKDWTSNIHTMSRRDMHFYKTLIFQNYLVFF